MIYDHIITPGLAVAIPFLSQQKSTEDLHADGGNGVAPSQVGQRETRDRAGEQRLSTLDQ